MTQDEWDDPEVRGRCKSCGEAIYLDDPPGTNCPDCKQALVDLHAAHKKPKPDPTPALVRKMVSVHRGD